MKKIRTIIIGILALFSLYTITGFFILPLVLTSVVPKNLSQALNRQASIEAFKVNPFSLFVEMKGLSISDTGGKEEFISARTVSINLEGMSIFKRAIIIRELKVEKPTIRIIRFPDNTYNFSDLLKGGKKKEKPLNFSLANIQVKDGRIVMEDSPINKTHTATGINITIPFISNIPYYTNVLVQPRFQAIVNNTPVILTGKTKPFSESLESTLNLNLKNINIPYYIAYLPMKPGFSVKSGSLDLDATITFRQFRDKRKAESNLTGMLACRELAIVDLSGKPLIHVPMLSVAIAPSQPLQGKIHLRKIAISSPEMTISRDRQGVLNLQTAFSGMKSNQPQPEQQNTKTAFLLTIDEFALENGKASFADLSGSLPVKLAAEDLTIRTQTLTTAEPGGGTVDITCTLNGSGNLSLGTSFTLKPLSADIKLNLDGFQPAWIQPYFIDQMPILIRHGTLSSKGLLKLAGTQNQPLKINFRGDVRVADIACVDRAHAEDLVSWKDLAINGIDFGMNPGRLTIQEITLSSPASTIIVNPDGGSNIGDILAQKPSRPSSPPGKQGKKSLENISVEKITITNGRFTFTDRSLEPHYSSSLTGISGNISGLSSDEFKKARIKLAAKLDNQSPISITGAINPLKKDLFVDLTALLNNIELTPMTPYSGKYLGYTIEKGKLSVSLKYLIDNKQLNSQNDVLIDQFTFGESVDSPDATKLPVRLAVALLRDKDGKIDLHLPVTGRTDDPQFRVGKIIIQMIVNILEKAATSPFALLEALYPGASQLNHIEFEPGRSTLAEDGKKKLSDLIKIMGDRPSLSLELKGYVDTTSDKSGLVSILSERKLKAVKLKDILRQGKQASSVDDIVIDPSEYSDYLKKAYKAESFPKPSTFLGIAKSLPDEEMKKLIIEHISVTDDDLKALASARSQQIRDYLMESGKIDPGRIFLIESDPLTPERIDTVANSRVSLTIK